MERRHLLLPRGRGREPIRVRLPEPLPTGTLAQAELGYGEIYLTLTREIPDSVPVPSDKAGGLDIGVIHLGMVSDGEEAMAVSGRGLRSVKQGRAQAQAKLRKKRARTKPGSRRRKRLNRARYRTSQKAARITRNALHHAANQIVAFCLAYGRRNCSSWVIQPCVFSHGWLHNAPHHGFRNVATDASIREYL